MITHDVNYMGKLKTTTLEEISKTLCSHLSTTQAGAVGNSGLVRSISGFGMVVEILGDTNITTKNQNIVVLIINNIDITKLQVEVTDQLYLHHFLLSQMAKAILDFPI